MSVDEQYASTSSDDLRVLVVGAGIAGITVAQLLRRQGRHPVLIERSGPNVTTGYMLALMPMVDPILDRLEVHRAYRDASTPMEHYGLRDRHGRLVRKDPIGKLLHRYGDYRGIDRASLIDVLSDPVDAGGRRADGCPVAYRTTIRATADEDVPGRPIMVGFGTRGDAEESSPEYAFDVVVLADGMGSQGRTLVIGDDRLDTTRTGWSGWVVWIEPDAEMDVGEELWGTGFFVGSYPVLGRIGVFVGGPDRELDLGRAAFVTSIRRRLTEIGPRVERVLTAVQDADDAYRWPMTDVRSPTWRRNGLVLLGDAAAGFMPTAGIGAGMAMESAGVLAAALEHAERSTVGAALAGYERVQRPRVEAAQKTSRQLARIMFNSSRLAAVGRDLASRFVDVGTAIKPIQRLLQDPPDLTEFRDRDQAGGPSRSSGSLR